MSDSDLSVNMKRDFKGVWIPKEVWLCQKLSAAEKVLWAELNSGRIQSNQRLMNFLGVDEQKLQQMIKNLEKFKGEA
jgi:hypothetical protein